MSSIHHLKAEQGYSLQSVNWRHVPQLSSLQSQGSLPDSQGLVPSFPSDELAVVSGELSGSKDFTKIGGTHSHKGHPDAVTLIENDRRRLKRQIANRDSARRVRARREETAGHLQSQMAVIGARNAAMITCIAVGQKQVESLKGQLQECSLCAQKALSENCRLRQNVDALTKKLQVRQQKPVQTGMVGSQQESCQTALGANQQNPIQTGMGSSQQEAVQTRMLQQQQEPVQTGMCAFETAGAVPLPAARSIKTAEPADHNADPWVDFCNALLNLDPATGELSPTGLAEEAAVFSTPSVLQYGAQLMDGQAGLQKLLSR